MPNSTPNSAGSGLLGASATGIGTTSFNIANGSNGMSASTINGIGPTGWAYPYQTSMQGHTIFKLIDIHGATIVTVGTDGTVKWANAATEDDAAKAFARSVSVGIEGAVGITRKVKEEMRDIVFNEILAMATELGTVTPEQLTHMWRAAKIIDKLKGINE